MRSHIAKLVTLKFPSDQLTIGELRQRFPEHFDQPSNDAYSGYPFFDDPFYSVGGVVREQLKNLLDCERQVALNAFVESLGESRAETHTFPSEEIDDLTALYQKFGIAKGPEHARQLIRDLERDAVNLADGRSRL
jgi:hypothetical protein